MAISPEIKLYTVEHGKVAIYYNEPYILTTSHNSQSTKINPSKNNEMPQVWTNKKV